LAVSRALPSLIIIGALTVGPARAQNLDQDTSGAKLFATNCTNCHRSPRGLAKDRFSWTLSSFLQQHYTASPTSAHALTAYLQSVDKPQPSARTSQPPGASGWPPRPPSPVPAR
jgi:mono/diheme cytochrome c family protein